MVEPSERDRVGSVQDADSFSENLFACYENGRRHIRLDERSSIRGQLNVRSVVKIWIQALKLGVVVA